MRRASFIHIADCHFDAPLRCKDATLRTKLRDATIEAFANAVNDAIDQEVDALLIAGDLFDSDRVSLEVQTRLKDEFERLDRNQISVFAVAGNHDSDPASGPGGFLNWPPNVCFIGSSVPTTIEVPSRRDDIAGPAFVLVAAGHESAAQSDNLVSRFPVAAEPIPHVGLVHAMVSSLSSSGEGLIHDRYAPCTTKDLQRTHYAYWALGHIHVPGPVAGTAAFYSGCIQGRHHKEGGGRGGYLVELDDDGVATVHFRQYATVVWTEVNLSDNLPDDLDGLQSRLASEVQSLRATYEGRDLAVRLTLAGQSSLAAGLRDSDESDRFASTMKSRLGLADLEIDTTRLFLNLDIGVLKSEPTVVAETIGLIERLIGAVDDAPNLPTPPRELLDGLAEDPSDISRERWKLLLADLELAAAERLINPESYRHHEYRQHEYRHTESSGGLGTEQEASQ